MLRWIAAAVVAAAALIGPQASGLAAAADDPSCSDVEVVFARGTFEAPGVGATGQAFVDALNARLGGKTVDVYGVNYPASLDFQAATDGIALPDGVAGTLPPAITSHVAAVVLFGTPSDGFLNLIAHNAPPITIGHLYTAKTIELCAAGDPICFPGGRDRAAHSSYKDNGMADQAADFTVHALTTRL